MEVSRKLLWGVDELIGYLRCGKKTFYQLLKLGLPVRQVVGGLWCGYTDNLDEFMAYMTGPKSPLPTNCDFNTLPADADSDDETRE